MLAGGVAVWPGTATHGASRDWLPWRPTTTSATVSWWASTGAVHTNFSAMCVPHCWRLSDTVDASRVVPTCAMGSADAVACGGAEVGERPATPTNTVIASTTAAAAAAVQVTNWVRRRGPRTGARRQGSRPGG